MHNWPLKCVLQHGHMPKYKGVQQSTRTPWRSGKEHPTTESSMFLNTEWTSNHAILDTLSFSHATPLL